MPKLLNDMRELMNKPLQLPVTVGNVVRVSESTVVVRTVKGLQECKALTPSQFEVGDRVRISNGIVVSKLVPMSSLPTYPV